MPTLKIAVITGGHPFDVQPFQQLYRALPDIDAYIQHNDAFISESEEVRDSYDAVVFYSMFRDTPTDEGPWYAEKARSALERMGETKQGIVLLHHALLAYRDWPMWDEIAGMQHRIMRSYHPNELVKVDIKDAQHPIVNGMASWDVIDETYVMDNAVMPDEIPGNHILFTTEHPRSMRPFGWTREYKQSRVFCFPSGHGYATYENPDFRMVLQRSIAWVARQI